MVGIDALEALLIGVARARATLTYAEVLAHFGQRVTPRRVYALCRDLGEVCRRNRARGEPELAVLVVRQSDRLPGEGFFRSAWREGAYDGPPTGPLARQFIRAEQDKVFAFFAPGNGGPRVLAAPAGSGPRALEHPKEGKQGGDDDDQADDVDDGVEHGAGSWFCRDRPGP